MLDGNVVFVCGFLANHDLVLLGGYVVYCHVFVDLVCGLEAVVPGESFLQVVGRLRYAEGNADQLNGGTVGGDTSRENGQTCFVVVFDLPCTDKITGVLGEHLAHDFGRYRPLTCITAGEDTAQLPDADLCGPAGDDDRVAALPGQFKAQDVVAGRAELIVAT